MTAEQRRITLAVCLIVGISLLMVAGLTFLIAPMAEDLRLPDRAVIDLLAIPSSAGLIMVFAAGQMGDRLGARRTLALASVAFSVGSALVMVASDEYLLTIGLAFCAAAAVTMQIVGLSMLQQATVDGPAQVSAVTSFGAVFPAAFLVFPVATAGLLEITSWRIVPLIWIIAGVVTFVISWTLPDIGAKVLSLREWWTPLLAGVALFAVTRAVSEIDDVQTDAGLLAFSVATFIIAVVAFLLVRRHMSKPSFSLAPMRQRELPLLLVAVGLVSLAGLLTYVSIAIEFLYALTPYEASLAVIPAQIGAILGAKILARFTIKRWGGVGASTLLMLFLALSTLPMALLSVDSPLWFIASVATVFSFAWMGVLTVLNTEVMRRAPDTHTGAVSSFRAAASSIGAAIGAGVLGSIVISSVEVEDGLSGVDGEALLDLTNSLRLVGVLASLIAMAGWILLMRVRHRSNDQETGDRGERSASTQAG